MRRRKTDLRARVNGDRHLEFADVALTSYAGLELFSRYLRTTRFNAVVRQAFMGLCPWGDFGMVTMVRVVIGLLVVGGRRLRHLAFVQDDPLFRRFCEVRVVPTARTLSRWLQAFTMATVERLQQINMCVVARVVAILGLRTWTIDVDGVVVSTGLQVERAYRSSGPAGRAGLSRVQPASAEGAQLLPDPGAFSRDDPRAAREESIGQCARRESRPAVSAGPVDPTAAAAAARPPRALSHGRGVFSRGCAALAGAARGRLRDQGALLPLVGSAAVHPRAADVAAGGAPHHRLCRARGGDTVGPAGVGRHLSEARHASCHEELSARPV